MVCNLLINFLFLILEPGTPCYELPCQNGGTCYENTEGGFTCTCPEGWQGKTCIEGMGHTVEYIFLSEKKDDDDDDEGDDTIEYIFSM